MTSFLSWVDYSATEQERMHRAIALFGEHEARDELGIGTIRDAFSEALFPGTSTIQTRLRYFLFIPWIYQNLEAQRLIPPKLNKRKRAAELALTEPLRVSGDSDGNFGQVAGEELKRLPSNVYWTGLRTWGILNFHGSQSQYHQALELIYQRRDSGTRPDDEGVELDRLATWHERLPQAPDNFPEGLTFQLTLEEAEYLQDRMRYACQDTMLAHLAQLGKQSSTGLPWLHPDMGTMPKRTRDELDLARRFSLVMHGAALLYNLILSEKSGRGDAEELRDKYRRRLAEWIDNAEPKDLVAWSPEDIWAFAANANASIPMLTRRFVESWMGRLPAIDLHQVADDEDCRRIVRDREHKLKGSRSRIFNGRALDQWGGASGTERLNYRWGIVQRLINDLHAGLHPEEV